MWLLELIIQTVFLKTDFEAVTKYCKLFYNKQKSHHPWRFYLDEKCYSQEWKTAELEKDPFKPRFRDNDISITRGNICSKLNNCGEEATNVQVHWSWAFKITKRIRS